MRVFKVLATFVALSAAAPAATGQKAGGEIKTPLGWSSPDGGMQLSVAAGWVRNEQPTHITGDDDRNVVLDASKSGTTKDVPGVFCKVRVVPIGQAQPGVTQASISAKIGVGAGAKLEERRVRMVDSVAVVDGFSGHAVGQMLASYLRGRDGYAADVRCFRNSAGDLTGENIKDIRDLFDSVRFTH